MGRAKQTVLGGLLALGLLSGEARAATKVKPLVEVGAEQRYDGYDGNAATAEALGHAELYSKLSPKLGLVAGSEYFKLATWYSPDLLYSALHGNLGVDHRAGVKLQARPSQATELTADAGFWKVSDPTSLPRLGVARVAQDVLYNDDKLGLTWHLSGRNHLTLDNRTEVAQIYEPGHPLPLTLTETPQLTWKHDFTARFQGLAAYRYQAFLGLPAVVGQAHAGLLGVQYRITHAWTGRLQAGPALYVPASGQVAPVPVAEGGLNWQGEYSQLDAVAGHEIVGALGYAVVNWADYAQLDWAYHPWRDWRFYLGAGAFRNGYAPAVPSYVLGYAVGGGAGYAITKELELQLSGQRISQVPFGPVEVAQLVDVNRNILAVRLNWAPAFDPKGL